MANDYEINSLTSRKIYTQNILIPTYALEWSIADLPVSTQLISKLSFFKFYKLGDLNLIPYQKILRKFIKVNLSSYNLVAELYTFLTSLQSTEKPLLTENENDFEEKRLVETQPKIEKIEIYNQEKSENPKIKHSPTAENAKSLNDDFESFLEETIFIAPIVKTYPVSLLILSVRLENVLRNLSIKILGDLHEMNFRQIFHSKNCGRKSIFELRDLIEKVHQSEVFVVNFDGKYDQSNFSETPEGKISVPESVKEMLIKYFSISNRLKNVLSNLSINTLSDLEIYSLYEIKQTGNCGQKTINELSVLINTLQDENFVEKLNNDYSRHLENVELTNVRLELIKRIETNSERQFETIIKNKEGKIFVPQSIREITVKSFVFSGTVEKIFDYLKINSLADFERYTFDEIKKAKKYSKKTIAELHNFIICLQQIASEEEMLAAADQLFPSKLNLNELLRFINGFLNELPDREREIIFDRFGNNQDEKILTLEEIGEKFSVTRERIRQMESQSIKELKSHLTGISEDALKKLTEDCVASVSPLTRRFLISLTGNEFSLFEHPPEFYLRMLNILSSEISVFFENQITSSANIKNKKLLRQIKKLLGEQVGFLTLAEVFERVSIQNTSDDLNIKDFFEAIQTNNFIIAPGDSADILLIKTDKNRLTMVEISRQVLAESDSPLTPEQIIKRAGEMFGSEVEMPSAHSLANLPGYEHDFYLLDKRTIGLRQHFRLPEIYWKTLQDDFYDSLKKDNRPISTTEVIAKNMFDWTHQTTASEATEILREDYRFRDLGRFLFSLAEWEIEERVSVKDLIVRVLEETEDALTATEIGARIQKYRSASTTTMPTVLRTHSEIRIFDFGYYGLKSKGDYSDFFITDRNFLNRFVKKNAPMTFSELRRKLNVDEMDEESGQKLWMALQIVSKVRFKPNYYLPETMISYKKW